VARRSPAGRVEPTTPDLEGDIPLGLHFIEPNLAFSLEDRKGGLVVLRIHFSLEAAPPWFSGDAAMQPSEWNGSTACAWTIGRGNRSASFGVTCLRPPQSDAERLLQVGEVHELKAPAVLPRHEPIAPN